MRSHWMPYVLYGLFYPLILNAASDQSATTNHSASPAITLNTPRDFPKITSRELWQERAKEIREQILVSSGLWPMPEKTPLHQTIFGKVLRDDYSVEKVYFQSYPGFYLAGNLYRPVGKGPGPFPAILNPHGHWENGRMVDTTNGSDVARCINFARQGMIAFSYDMVGYNDTHFPESPVNATFSSIHHNFATNDSANLLWSVSLMGLQTWNSIRALDFLESLPDADKRRLACTGASGGGTQTFILGAIDDRLAAIAPVVMVSHTMQGGCSCENMPGLRVEFSNMEIAAAAAPRPQILVGATGDWTKTMLEFEGPAIEHIYELFQTPEKLRYVRFDFPHNYNQTSREAVYQWFDKWLLDQPDAPVKELAYQKEPDQELRVFPDGKLPSNAVSQKELIRYLINTHRTRLQALQPADKVSLENYKNIMEPAWERTMQLKSNGTIPQATVRRANQSGDYTADEIEVNSDTANKQINLIHFSPAANKNAWNHPLILLVHQQGEDDLADRPETPTGLAKKLLDRHYDVAVLGFASKDKTEDQASILYNTYNRTILQQHVGDIVAACRACSSLDHKQFRVVVCGIGGCGLPALLAAPAATAVVADCAQLDVSDDKNLLAPDLFCPGIRNIDAFSGGAILAAPHPLLIYGLAEEFPTSSLRTSYNACKAADELKLTSNHLNDDQIVAWISRLIKSY